MIKNILLLLLIFLVRPTVAQLKIDASLFYKNGRLVVNNKYKNSIPKNYRFIEDSIIYYVLLGNLYPEIWREAGIEGELILKIEKNASDFWVEPMTGRLDVGGRYGLFGKIEKIIKRLNVPSSFIVYLPLKFCLFQLGTCPDSQGADGWIIVRGFIPARADPDIIEN